MINFEKIKDIYYISQLENVLKEKNNVFYKVGIFSIYNGKIAYNKVVNQAYNFAYNKAKKSDITKYLKNANDVKLYKLLQDTANTLNIANI